MSGIWNGKREREMSICEKILLCMFVIGVTIFFIGAGIGILWMIIEDTIIGRAIDEIVGERIERWKNERSD